MDLISVECRIMIPIFGGEIHVSSGYLWRWIVCISFNFNNSWSGKPLYAHLFLQRRRSANSRASVKYLVVIAIVCNISWRKKLDIKEFSARTKCILINSIISEYWLFCEYFYTGPRYLLRKCNIVVFLYFIFFLVSSQEWYLCV